jgi:hypothetical protein
MSGDGQQPQMDEWRELHKEYRAAWTGRGQGVATNGVSWFVSQNDGTPGVSRYSADFATLEARVEIPRWTAGHVGAVSVHDDRVFVALEGPERVMILTTDLVEVSLVAIERSMESDFKKHLAWCAINPDNGLLYTCDWVDAVSLTAYDPTTGLPKPEHDIALSKPVNRAQGGDFSSNGNLYLASDDQLSYTEQFLVLLRLKKPSRQTFPGIHGFDVRTGESLGYIPIATRPLLPHSEEIEGIGLGPMTIDGTTAHLHLSFLSKNHSWIRDDVEILSYVLPDTGDL